MTPALSQRREAIGGRWVGRVLNAYQLRPLKSNISCFRKSDSTSITCRISGCSVYSKIPLAVRSNGGSGGLVTQASHRRRGVGAQPYNWAALATQQPAPPPGSAYCRECGKAIEADARFCRFCGKSQADRPASASATATRSPSPAPASSQNRPVSRTADGLESWLRQLFPRHQQQDEFMHVGSIAAFLMALIGFVLGFIYAFNFLAVNFLLASVALSLFLMLRESTLGQIRSQGGDLRSSTSPGRNVRPASSSDLPTEAATTQSSPPPAGRSSSPK